MYRLFRNTLSQSFLLISNEKAFISITTIVVQDNIAHWLQKDEPALTIII